jgi:hypothetical protein
MSLQSQSQSVGTGQVESLTDGDEEIGEEDDYEESDDDEEAADVADARAEGDLTCGVKAKEASRTRYYREKQKVILTSQTGKRVTSGLWKGAFFRMASLAEDWNNSARQLKLKRLPGLLKVQSYKHPAVCTLCYHNLLKPLRNCVFSTQNWNPMHLETHLKECHNKEVAPELYVSKEEKMQAPIIKEAGRVTATGSILSFEHKLQHILKCPERCLDAWH